MNPAVSLAMVILGKLKIWKFPFYVIAQFLGAFAGAAAVFGLYYGEYITARCINGDEKQPPVLHCGSKTKVKLQPSSTMRRMQLIFTNDMLPVLGMISSSCTSALCDVTTSMASIHLESKPLMSINIFFKIMQ